MDGSQYDHSTLEALDHPHRARAAQIVHHAREVVAQLEYYGPGIVPHLLDTDDNSGQRLRAALAADHNTTETTDQSRPVVGLVAHVVDLDAIEAREDEHYAVRVDVPALVAEVRRLREREAALIRAKDVDLDDVRDQLADVEAARTADAATIGVLAAAVAKVAALHVDDGDGWCKACQTLGYPCPTVVALGAGR